MQTTAREGARTTAATAWRSLKCQRMHETWHLPSLISTHTEANLVFALTCLNRRAAVLLVPSCPYQQLLVRKTHADCSSHLETSSSLLTWRTEALMIVTVCLVALSRDLQGNKLSFLWRYKGHSVTSAATHRHCCHVQ